MSVFSIIQKSQLEGAKRLDAEYYCSPRLLGGNDFYTGADVVSFVQYGTSEELNEEDKGYPVLRLNEFEEYFSGIPVKSCEKLSEEQFEELKLKKGDVLITRTNGNPALVGKAALVMKNSDVAFASYLFRVRPEKTKINSATLVAFLDSKFGRSEIEKYLMPSIQSNFSPAKFREIKIPKFSDIFLQKIENLFNTAYSELQNSKSIYAQAEDLLLEELGLKDFKADEDLYSIVNFSDIKSVNRMDAEYFQPKYEQLMKRMKEKSKIKQIEEIASVKRGSLIGPVFYDESGTPYIRGGDFSSGRLEKEKFVYINNRFQYKNETKIKEGDIVFALIGSVGTSALVSEEFDNSFISNNVGKISIKDKREILPDYFAIVLQSIIGKFQFEKEMSQTAQPKISDSLVRNFYIPILSEKIQQKIAELVRESHAARKKARELLEEAKRKVEELIESQKL